jgi:exportin-1
MSLTIEELDATVRAFYEGRGEQQKQAQATLNQVGGVFGLIVGYR